MLHNPISGVMSLLTTGNGPPPCTACTICLYSLVYRYCFKNIATRTESQVNKSSKYEAYVKWWDDIFNDENLPWKRTAGISKITYIFLERKIIFPTFIFGFHVMLTFCPKNPDPSKICYFWGPPKTPLLIMQVHSPFHWRVQPGILRVGCTF